MRVFGPGGISADGEQRALMVARRARRAVRLAKPRAKWSMVRGRRPPPGATEYEVGRAGMQLPDRRQRAPRPSALRQAGGAVPFGPETRHLPQAPTRNTESGFEEESLCPRPIQSTGGLGAQPFL